MAWRVLLGLALLVAFPALVGFLALCGTPLTPGVSAENFAWLREGMTEREVEAVLGGPADSRDHFTGNHYSTWLGEGCTIDIRFSDMDVPGYDGAIGGKLLRPQQPDLTLRPRPVPAHEELLRLMGF